MLGPNDLLIPEHAREIQADYRRQSEQAYLALQVCPEFDVVRLACRGLGYIGRLMIALGKRLERLDGPAATAVQPVRSGHL